MSGIVLDIVLGSWYRFHTHQRIFNILTSLEGRFPWVAELGGVLKRQASKLLPTFHCGNSLNFMEQQLVLKRRFLSS